MNNLSTHLNDIYYHYLLIEDKAYSEKINFVEEYYSYISKLDTVIRIEILYNYAVALFELGRFNQVISISSKLAETVIVENIKHIGELNIFEELLYLKGEAHLSKNETQKSLHVFSELIKMNSGKKKFKEALIQTNKQINMQETQKIRAICMSLFIGSGIIIALELLLIRPFYPEQISLVEITRNSMFVLGMVSYISYTLFEKYRNRKVLKDIIQSSLSTHTSKIQ